MEALKDGVAEAAANPPDIILLDLGLPDSNGVETMQRLQAELPEVPIIVLTGIEDEDLGIQAIRSHAQDYLTKSLASGHVLSRTIIYALERSSLRRHLVRADRLAAVGELAAGIAHEVNNPAAFVMANLEVMRDDVASVREAFETLVDLARRTDAAAVDRLLKESELTRKLADWTDIVDESYVGMERIRVLIRDLRTFSRIEAFDIEPVSVNDVVNSACNMLQHELRQRVRLGKDLGDVPLVAADRRRLEQVITNLMINALHAIDRADASSNEVLLKTHMVDDEVVVQVEDSGCGVPDDLKERIFEPFFTTKASDAGTGLGLSLSADIVAKLGGRIVVTDRPGGGSIFALFLPVSTEAEAAPTRASVPGAPGHSSVRARILVIDDERSPIAPVSSSPRSTTPGWTNRWIGRCFWRPFPSESGYAEPGPTVIEPLPPPPRAPSQPRAPASGYTLAKPGSFSPEKHFYPRVLNAQIHSMVRFFQNLDAARIIGRYCHLNPRVVPEELARIMAYQPRFFRWAGSDLMHVTTEAGARQMVVVETNSCPSGQKSMPLYEEHDEQGGYRVLMEHTFRPLIGSQSLPDGGLAVLYDKNHMESSGYAAAMADGFDEPVHLVRFEDDAQDPRVRFDDGHLFIRNDQGDWLPIRCAFRYVTQRPWNRLPVTTKSVILNPVLACLAGGRNKAMAAKAYDLYNAELAPSGLEIKTPRTYSDVSWNEIPLWVKRFGGHAVIKVPYSNAGQGIYTITNPQELNAFLALEQRYDRFIVQSLIGNYHWSSVVGSKRLYHVGTIPDRHLHSYAADLRVMVSAGPTGFRPLAIYARRAREPLTREPPGEDGSWNMLGTNLSVKDADGRWETESARLMIMDRKDFNNLGVGLDELIEAYIQTVLCTIAIDRMAIALTGTNGKLDMKLFRSLNSDPALLREVLE